LTRCTGQAVRKERNERPGSWFGDIAGFLYQLIDKGKSVKASLQQKIIGVTTQQFGPPDDWCGQALNILVDDDL
jgi:hypothetical protein